MDRGLLETLNAERRARRAVIRVTNLATGAERLVREAELDPADPLGAELAGRFRSAKSGMVETADGGRLFLTVHVPPPRLVCIGAVHITQALAPMARMAGFDVTVIDPRTAFATEARFEGVPLFPDWPDDVIPGKVGLDAYTGLVAVTHDPKIDDWPIARALEAGSFYVGALGSRKTHAKRVERLTASGVDPAAIARIAAPIGLDIGAQSPAEIAVAVLAQAIQALRRRPAAEAAKGGTAAEAARGGTAAEAARAGTTAEAARGGTAAEAARDGSAADVAPTGVSADAAS
ncbi:XdhC family protein [Prosthecomicrobium hirschii]|uniref:XdhC family protein n=1 Tax=Prosthecodimorpha hirschii TaxID=665126 RepID=UPI0030B8F478